MISPPPKNPSGTTPVWSIITVTFNSAGALTEYWSDYSPGPNEEWIVVDNGSKDATTDIADALGAKVVERAINGGFAVANNEGVGYAQGDYLAFVNPDVRIVSADLHRLRAAIDRTGGLVCPQLINRDGSLQPNGRGLPFLVDKLGHRGVSVPGQRLEGYLLLGHERTLRTVAWAMGAAVCARASTFKFLGMWNEDFFLYYEDHELGLRSWRAGVPMVVDGDIRWEHGWRRETLNANPAAWRHELVAAARFYKLFPELLFPTRRWAQKRHPWADRLFQAWDRTGPS